MVHHLCLLHVDLRQRLLACAISFIPAVVSSFSSLPLFLSSLPLLSSPSCTYERMKLALRERLFFSFFAHVVCFSAYSGNSGMFASNLPILVQTDMQPRFYNLSLFRQPPFFRFLSFCRVSLTALNHITPNPRVNGHTLPCRR